MKIISHCILGAIYIYLTKAEMRAEPLFGHFYLDNPNVKES